MILRFVSRFVGEFNDEPVPCARIHRSKSETWVHHKNWGLPLCCHQWWQYVFCIGFKTTCQLVPRLPNQQPSPDRWGITLVRKSPFSGVMLYIYNNIYIYINYIYIYIYIIEGSLEVKLPTIWTDSILFYSIYDWLPCLSWPNRDLWGLSPAVTKISYVKLLGVGHLEPAPDAATAVVIQGRVLSVLDGAWKWLASCHLRTFWQNREASGKTSTESKLKISIPDLGLKAWAQTMVFRNHDPQRFFQESGEVKKKQRTSWSAPISAMVFWCRLRPGLFEETAPDQWRLGQPWAVTSCYWPSGYD